MANTNIRVTELDHDTIKNNLKTYLQSQAEFTDYDFEGSGMNVLLDLLAYNTHYMGFYLNMVGNEMFLDTAQLRASAISHGKLVNYYPRSTIGASAKVNILVTPGGGEDTSATQITLDKYTTFLGEDLDGVNHQFVTIYSNSAIKVNSSFSFANVWIKQGEVVTRQWQMDSSSNPDRRFTISSPNVDLSTLQVSVQRSTSNTYTEAYKLYTDITELTGSSKVYFAEEDVDGQYVIQFGDNILGKQPIDGSIIIATYLDTNGNQANNISNFTLSDAISDEYSNNVAITIVDKSFGGADKETVDQIRFRAPYAYTAQNRAVTKLDYETLLMRDYPIIEAVSVWGGEDNADLLATDTITPGPIYGKVFISIKTRGNYALSVKEKENIVKSLITYRSITTVTPEIIDPVYVYLLIGGTVYYNPSLTNLTSNQIRTLAAAAVNDYNNEKLNTFDITFRKSKLQTYIEASEKSITGSDVDVFVQRRVELDTSVAKTYTVNFDMPLSKGDFTNKLYTYPQIKVLDAGSTVRNVFFEEVPNSFTGVDKIDIVNPGAGYTANPTVTITGDGTGATATATIIGGKLAKITITNKGTNYTRASVSITGGGGGSGATGLARLESRYGVLRTFYYNTNSEKIIVNSDAGEIDYDRGSITLKSLSTSGTVSNDFYDANILTINVPPENDVIEPLKNRIITLDENSSQAIQLTMETET